MIDGLLLVGVSICCHPFHCHSKDIFSIELVGRSLVLAILWQFFFLGTVGAIFYGSALLAGIIMAVLIPVTEVLAVVFFHEPFSGGKGVALALALWGFASYFYGEFLESKKKNPVVDPGPPASGNN